jgi:serine protease inhibitor
VTDVAMARGVPRLAPDGAQMPAAVSAVQSFGADLYRRLAAAPGNLAMSPLSVAVALAMTRNGAAGTTAAELDRVLHAPALPGFNAGLNALVAELESRAGDRERADRSSTPVALDVADALWCQRGVAWQEPFLTALAQHYGTGARLVDYVKGSSAARAAINDWTSRQTHGRITELVPEGLLGVDTRLVLVNAVYLKAAWNLPFEKGATRQAPFTRADGSSVTVAMMRTEPSTMQYATGPAWQAVDLPYAGSELAMAVILPEQGRLAEVEQGLDGPALHRLLTGFHPTPGTLALPKWTFRTRVVLSDHLAGLGMASAFTDRADFSAMTTQEQLCIDEVLHEAFVAVDEHGTEASAATAVVMRRTSLMLEQLVVTVDRPFLFVIHDIETATPLFVGRVNDPTAG